MGCRKFGDDPFAQSSERASALGGLIAGSSEEVFDEGGVDVGVGVISEKAGRTARIELPGAPQVLKLAEVAPAPLENASGDAQGLGIAVEPRIIEVELVGEQFEGAIVADGRAQIQILAGEERFLAAQLLASAAVAHRTVDQPLALAELRQHRPRQRQVVRLLERLPEAVNLLHREALAGEIGARPIVEL